MLVAFDVKHGCGDALFFAALVADTA